MAQVGLSDCEVPNPSQTVLLLITTRWQCKHRLPGPPHHGRPRVVTRGVSYASLGWVSPQLQGRGISFSVWLSGVFSVLSSLTRGCSICVEIPAVGPSTELCRISERGRRLTGLSALWMPSNCHPSEKAGLPRILEGKFQVSCSMSRNQFSSCVASWSLSIATTESVPLIIGNWRLRGAELISPKIQLTFSLQRKASLGGDPACLLLERSIPHKN